jgi:glycosyltransferase involved in cell wall biosynthesis
LRLTILIPAHNEEQNLPSVLVRIPRLPQIIEVLIVDGHSQDKTVQVAKEIMPEVKVVQQQGTGKGDAIVSGASIAVGDHFLVLDADGSQIPDEIVTYIEKTEAGYDLVKGSRYMKGGSSDEDTLDRKLVTRVAQFMANTLWHTRFSDICYGMFLINRQKFLELGINSQRHDVEWEIMAKAARHGLKIIEVPAYEAKRISGHSHVSYTRDGWLIAKAIFREFFRGLWWRK